MKKVIIIHNRIECLRCGDIIESTFRHDFVMCSCGACAVDGGKDYLRRQGNRGDWVDRSEVAWLTEDASLGIIEGQKTSEDDNA